MFQQLRFFFAITILTLFFLYSCSDSSTNTNEPTNKSYFPTSIGSYWKYVEYEIDSLGVKVPDSEDTTITRVVANQMIQGKNAAILVRQSTKNESIDTSIFAYENEKIYTLLSFFNNEFIPIGEGNQWVMIADFNATQWTILNDTTLESFDLPDIGKITPTVGIKGKKGNKVDVVVKGKPIPSQEFILTFSFKMKLQIPNVPLPINFNFDVVQHFWFGEGVGLVKERLDPFKFSVVVMEQSFNGNQSDLIDYQIK